MTDLVTRYHLPERTPKGPPAFEAWRDGVLSQHSEMFPGERSLKGRTVYRTIQLDHTRAQSEQRTIEAVLATGADVQRRGYVERLDMSPDAINLERAQDLDGLPLLWSHKPDVHLGFCENVRVHGGALRARLKFTDSAEATEKWRAIENGTLRSLSIGYEIEDDQYTERQGEAPLVTAKRWTPVEASLVTIPADTKARIGRSLDYGLLTEPPQELQHLRLQREALQRYDTLVYVAEGDDAVNRIEETLSALRSQLLAAKTQSDFDALTRAFDQADAELESITDEFEISTVHRADPEPTTYTRSNFFEKRKPVMKKEYSLCRALAAQFDPSAARGATYELQTAEALRARTGRTSEGVMIPESAIFTRALDKATEGTDLVAVSHMADMFIEALRPRLVVGQLGATILPGLQGDVQIPRKTADSSASWIAGDGADSVSQSVPTFDKVEMSPTTVGVQCTISRKMLLQGDPTSEQLVRDTLAYSVAQALDVAALVGSGSSNQPLGILNVSGIGSLEYTNGGSPTFANIVGMEGELSTDNADLGNLGYVAHSGMATALKTTDVNTDTGRFVWTSTGNGEGTMNGYKARVSNNLTEGHVLFGNWSDLLIGFWSGLDVVVDPYTRAAYGDVIVTVMQDVDIAVRHPESFCELKEAAS